MDRAAASAAASRTGVLRSTTSTSRSTHTRTSYGVNEGDACDDLTVHALSCVLATTTTSPQPRRFKASKITSRGG